jgi:hypothetical protein
VEGRRLPALIGFLGSAFRFSSDGGRVKSANEHRLWASRPLPAGWVARVYLCLDVVLK